MRHTVIGLLLAALCLTDATAQTGCRNQFADGQPPSLVNQKLATYTRGLCFRAFAVLHSGVTRTPLWSAEHLTRDRIESARSVQRTNLFHPEGRLPPTERSELPDYARSGFDRGHMSPSGDMPDEASQAESFSLANMVPQDHKLNTGLWSSLESGVRTLTRREGDLYVVTGPVFEGAQLQSIGSGVIVPSAVFKAVYSPRRGGAAAYLSRNTENAGVEVISIVRLRDLIGIDLFPSLPDSVKETAIVLPEPRQRGRRRGGEQQ